MWCNVNNKYISKICILTEEKGHFENVLKEMRKFCMLTSKKKKKDCIDNLELKLVNQLIEYDIMKSKPKLSQWRSGDQKVFVSDIKKISNLTGWKPKVSTEEGIKLLVQWCKKNGNLLGNVLNN